MGIERVTYLAEGRTRSVLLDVISHGNTFLTGREVDSEGSLKAPSRKHLQANNAVDGEIIHLIENKLITCRQSLKVDWKYGTLTDA